MTGVSPGSNHGCAIGGHHLLHLHCGPFFATLSIAGWVERSEPHHGMCFCRWVSLRSTHPTKTRTLQEPGPMKAAMKVAHAADSAQINSVRGAEREFKTLLTG